MERTNYTTKSGKTLEVVGEPSTFHEGLKHYTMCLRTKREMGEDIELLLEADLTTPDYFIRKYIEEN